MRFIDKLKMRAALLWHSLFYAMRAGDNELSSNVSLGSDSSIDHHVTIGGVMDELLRQEETQQVKEIRDEYYRILNEADKYRVQVQMSIDDEGNVNGMSATARKKTAADFSQHCVVYNEEDLQVRVIQDNKHIEKQSYEVSFSTKSGIDIWDYDTTLNINWGDITPRFRLNKFVSKIVVRTINNTEAFVDLYLPTIAGQFSKLDAIMISELNRLFKDEDYKSDIKNINGFSFVTDKAWNSDNLCLFEYDNAKYNSINVFDGNFVLTFKCHLLSDGFNITEKFRTKEVDEKYENNTPKKDATDLFVIDRHIGGIDFGETSFKIK